MSAKSTIYAVAGPTASGKSAVALAVAQTLGYNLLSADARQLYMGMDIGTNKPSAAERSLVPHFGLDLAPPSERYNAARYTDYALTVLAEHPRTLLVGGTGLYLRTLAGWMDEMPQVSLEVTAQVEADQQTHGLSALLTELAQADPATYATIDRNNPARIIRAVALYRATGRPISSFRTGQQADRPFHLQLVCLDVPRAALYQRINERVHQMMAAGLLAEVDHLLATYGPEAPGLQTIGYRELVDWRLGRLPSLDAAVTLIQQHTRNYAKRQLTWFRHQPDVVWLPPATAVDWLLARSNHP